MFGRKQIGFQELQVMFARKRLGSSWSQGYGKFFDIVNFLLLVLFRPKVRFFYVIQLANYYFLSFIFVNYFLGTMKTYELLSRKALLHNWHIFFKKKKQKQKTSNWQNCALDGVGVEHYDFS